MQGWQPISTPVRWTMPGRHWHAAHMAGHWHIGIDTGGTFTDLVAWNGKYLKTVKVPSSARHPGRAIHAAIEALDLPQGDRIHALVVGTTVATNAVLENKGARVALVTNRGFADLLTLGRQQRFELFNLDPEPWPPPVPPELCHETAGRISAEGAIIDPIEAEDLEELAAWLRQQQPDAVAVNLLFSYRRPEVETRLAEAIPEPVFTSLSSQVLPEQKEYERGMATWLNAAVGPVVQAYIEGLDDVLPVSRWSLMRSDATTVDSGQAAAQAVRLLLSGPAGGLGAALHTGRSLGVERLLTLDMGGTSTDVAMLDGAISLTRNGRIGRYPVAVPMVDMHTIGAGGGSMAQVDAGGVLKVGPESAGADPGPACYGKGGRQATVTDANVVLGRIPPDSRLGGTMTLDVAAAGEAIDGIAEQLDCSRIEAALGIIALANEQMARALRVISVERGQSLAGVHLISFGGAGGLHVCELAEQLDLARIIVPAGAGVLSALGMLVSPVGRETGLGVNQPADQCPDSWLDEQLNEITRTNAAELLAQGIDADALSHTPWVELRFLGQGAFHRVPWTGELSDASHAFRQWHDQRFGYELTQPVEVVNIGVSSRGPAAVDESGTWSGGIAHGSSVERSSEGAGMTRLADLGRSVRVHSRDDLETTVNGPCVVVDSEATVYLPPGWVGRLAGAGLPHLLLERMPESQ